MSPAAHRGPRRPRVVPVTAPDPGRPWRLPEPVPVVVIGGGLAGMAAATVLAERGAAVTVLERAPQVGGRLAAWSHRLADGSTQSVEHGFHAFFRQYHNVHALLRRLDPTLAFLRPVPDYPVISREWPDERFAGLPGRPPLNLLGLLVRSPSVRLADLVRMNGAAATPMLAFDRQATYREFDRMTAATFLDRLQVPRRARTLLFDVFAHSFFNDETTMSAAEMIMMFHFYFLGNPEGLGFDAIDEDYQAAVWGPLTAYLEHRAGVVRTGAEAAAVEPGGTGGRWSVRLEDGSRLAGEHVVLAADADRTRALVARSPGLTSVAPVLARQAATLGTAPPYAVARLWTDADCAPGRAAFSSVAGERQLDSITVYHRVERESARWAARTGGGVFELHGYCTDRLEPPAMLTALRGQLAAVWPETAPMGLVDGCCRVGTDAPSFDAGSDADRPAVRTDAPGVALAGDWVKLPFPTALMERATASGLMAANAVLDELGASLEPVVSIPPRGLLARPRAGPGHSRLRRN